MVYSRHLFTSSKAPCSSIGAGNEDNMLQKYDSSFEILNSTEFVFLVDPETTATIKLYF